MTRLGKAGEEDDERVAGQGGWNLSPSGLKVLEKVEYPSAVNLDHAFSEALHSMLTLREKEVEVASSSFNLAPLSPSTSGV